MLIYLCKQTALFRTFWLASARPSGQPLAVTPVGRCALC